MSINPPAHQIPYEDLLKRIEEDFLLRARLQPVKLRQYYAEIDARVDNCSEIYKEQIRSDWRYRFPKTPFSEELLKEKLEFVLQLRKFEAADTLIWNLEKDRRFHRFHHFLFRRQDWRFLVTLLLSLFTLPLFLNLFSSQTRLIHQAGMAGLFANLGIICFFFGNFFKKTAV